MAEQVFPTKGNLIKTKRQLAQAIMGFELMDRKRNVLVHEIVAMADTAKAIRSDIDITYAEAYKALETANITLGLVGNLAQMFPIENSLSLSSHSVMGVELPTLAAEIISHKRPIYAMERTNSAFDRAYMCFNKVKVLTVQLAQTENSILEAIAANAEVEIPQAMIEREIDGLVQKFEYQLMYQGLKLQDYLDFLKITNADFRKNYAEQAEKNVKSQLIISQLIKDEKIEATEEEVDAKVAEQAASVNKTAEEYKKNMFKLLGKN